MEITKVDKYIQEQGDTRSRRWRQTPARLDQRRFTTQFYLTQLFLYQSEAFPWSLDDLCDIKDLESPSHLQMIDLHKLFYPLFILVV